MIHYIRQFITHLSPVINPILITREIPDIFPGIPCYRYGLSPSNIFCEYREIVKTIQSFNPDIIHITSGHILLVPLMRKFSKIPIIITLHDVSPHTGENTWLHRFIIASQIRHATHIFVHGSSQKSELVNTGIDEKKISIISLGDFAFFSEYSDEGIPEENAILFFGRIVEYKGLHHLLDAMTRLPENFRIKLIIAGEGDLTPYRESLARIDHDLLEIHNRYIEDNEVAGFFQRAKLVVLPYTDGTQTGIIPIAYVFNKPVIATDVGSFSEAIDDGKTGLLVQKNSPASLRTAIIRLIEDDSLRKRMGENGHLKMQNDLSWETVILKTVQVYTQVVNSRK